MSLLEKLCKFNIDQAYCISIKNNKLRQERTILECEKINQKFDFLLVEKNNDPILGCLKSHIECIKKSKSLGHKNILIMEDDIKFDLDVINNLINKDIKLFEKQDFDMLYLGYHINRGYKYTENILKIISAQTTHCYIINHSIFDIIINDIDKDWNSIKEFNDRNNLEKLINWSVRAIDLFYSKWIHHRRNRTYGFYPLICYQYEGWSDIENKNINYNNIMINKSKQFYNILPLKNNYKTLVLNLERRSDRWNNFVNNTLINNYTKFKAIDGKTFNFSPYLSIFNISDFSCCEIKNPYKSHGYEPGVLGCALSHYNMWTLISQDNSINDLDFYLILEDDIKYTDNFNNKLNNLYNYLITDKKWDVTYLGYTDYYDTFKQDKKIGNNLIKFGGQKRLRGGGTFAYFIRKKGAKLLLNCVKNYGIKQAIDWFMIEHYDKGIFYKCENHLIFSDIANNNNNVDTDIQSKDYIDLKVISTSLNNTSYLKDQYNNYFIQNEYAEINYKGTLVNINGSQNMTRKRIKHNMITTNISKLNNKKLICFYSANNSCVMIKNLAELLSDKFQVIIFNKSYDMIYNNVQYLYYEKFGKFSSKISIDYLIITDITFFLYFYTSSKNTILWNINLLDKPKLNNTYIPNSGIHILHNILNFIDYIICPSDFSKLLFSSKANLLPSNKNFNIIPYSLFNNNIPSLNKNFNYRFISFDSNLVVIIKFFQLIKQIFPLSTIIVYTNDISSFKDDKIIIKKRNRNIMDNDLKNTDIFVTYENQIDTYYNILKAMNNECIVIFSNYFSNLKSKGITYTDSLLDNTFIEYLSQILINENKRNIYKSIGKSFTQNMNNDNILKQWYNILS